MKKLLIILLFISFTVIGQVPQYFNYQAIVRDATGLVISNKAISFKLSILKTTSTGAIQYAETQTVQSNHLGIVNLTIGSGTVVSGAMNTVAWSSDVYFLKVEMDINGGTSYITYGTSQLVSVPYAMYAQTAGNSSQWLTTGNNISYSTGNVNIGTTNSDGMLNVNGMIGTNCIKIRGGCDLIEPFMYTFDKPEPGMIAEIDYGKFVTTSRTKYSKRVIGVVSGANNYPYGIALGDVLEGIHVPISISGTVYVRTRDLDIKPGDLLASNGDGTAIKAKNIFKRHGAIIGKALEAPFKGFVLIIINLQ